MHLLLSLAVHLQAVFTPAAPRFDGTLDDPIWQRALASADFTQKAPEEGSAPTERTVLRVLYDAEALYVGFQCEQLHALIAHRLSRRGTILESDWVSIDVGSRRDGKSAFEFAVNASGVLADGLRFNDTDFSTDWHENWEARTRVRDG